MKNGIKYVRDIIVNILINAYKKINNEVKLLSVDHYVRKGRVWNMPDLVSDVSHYMNYLVTKRNTVSVILQMRIHLAIKHKM